MPDEPKDETTPQEFNQAIEDQEVPTEPPVPIESPGISNAEGTSISSDIPETQVASGPAAPMTETLQPAATQPIPFGTAAETAIAPLPPKKKGKKALIIGLIAAGAGVLIIGGGALAYNVWYQNPNKVVSDAIVNAITAKTFSATGSLEIETDDYRMKIEASGKNNLDANSQVAVKLSYATDELNVTVDGEGIYSAAGDLYVKLNDAQELAASIEEQSNGQVSFDVFDNVIEKVDGKWVKIGKEDLGDLSEEYEKAQKCFADISKQLDEDTAFRRTVEGETKDLYQSNQFVIVGDKLGSRTINGQGSLGYTLSADAEIADAFFTGLTDTQLGKKLQECNDDIKLEDIVSDSAKEDDGTETHAEIWVSRFGHMITEINLHTDEDGAKGAFILHPVFNANEAIEIPTDVIPFSELQADIEKAYEEYYASYYDDVPDDEFGTMTEFN